MLNPQSIKLQEHYYAPFMHCQSNQTEQAPLSPEDLNFIEKLRASFVDGIQTNYAIATLLQNQKPLKLSNDVLQDSCELLSPYSNKRIAKSLNAWLVLRIYHLMLSNSKYIKAKMESCFLNAEFTHITITKLQELANLSINGPLNSAAKLETVLKDGVRNRFSSHVKDVIGELLTFVKNNEQPDLLLKMQDIFAILGTNPQGIIDYLNLVIDETFAFEDLLVGSEYNENLKSKNAQVQPSPNMNTRKMQESQWKLGISNEDLKNMHLLPEVFSSGEISIVSALKDEYEHKFLHSEVILLKDEYEKRFNPDSFILNSRSAQDSLASRAMRSKIQRTFNLLKKLKEYNFSNPRYLELVGPVPYPHAFLITMGAFSPYHLGHAEVLRVGKEKIICQHYIDFRLKAMQASNTDSQQDLEEVLSLECNSKNVFSLIGFSTDYDILLKGGEFQHLMIGERVKIIEMLENIEVVHETNNIFGVSLDEPSRDSSSLGLNSEVLDIVFLVAVAPYINSAPTELMQKYPSVVHRLQRLEKDSRYAEHFDILKAQHALLDENNECDRNTSCQKKVFEIFDDVSNPTLVSNDSSSLHFNNRMAAASTNFEKTKVLEEHTIYRNVSVLLPRDPSVGNSVAGISATKIRNALNIWSKVENENALIQRRNVIRNFLDEKTVGFMHRLGLFFEKASLDSSIRALYLEFNHQLSLRSKKQLSSIFNFISLLVGRPVPFRVSLEIFDSSYKNLNDNNTKE